MSYPHNKHWHNRARAGHNPAARDARPSPAAQKPDFWAEHGPLLILLLSALAFAIDLVALGARLAQRSENAPEEKADR